MENFSYIHPDAKIGKDVTISPFVTIYEDVVIGDGTYIHPNVTLYPGARIGKNCKIHSFASIACTPQDLKFKGEVTTAQIGDNCEIRECVTISRGTASTGTTIIGSNNLLMAYSHVGHDCVIGSNCVIVNGVSLAGEVHVGDWVVIGGHSAVHQWTHIGDHAMIQGMSGVTKDIPPYITASKDDHYAGINKTGLSRRGFTHEQIMAIHDVCRILFQSDLNYMNACDKAEAELPQSPERDYLLNFVRSSQRGCIKPYVKKVNKE